MDRSFGWEKRLWSESKSRKLHAVNEIVKNARRRPCVLRLSEENDHPRTRGAIENDSERTG
jgi:hypothetical protein